MTLRTLVTAGALALAAAPALAQGGPPPAAVGVEPVRSERLQKRRRVPGTVRAARRSLVAAREGGVVLEMPVRDGQVVEEGDLLARLDNERLLLMLATVDAEKLQLEALLEERRAQLDQAERDLKSVQALSREDAANPRELADAGSAVRIATARVRQEERRLGVIESNGALLRRRIADAEVRAPFGGTVVRRQAEIGQWAGEGDPIVEILSTGDVEAWLEVPQGSLEPVAAKHGDIEITVDATGVTHRVSNWRLLREVDPRTRTFFVIASLPADASLAPGLSLTASVPEAEEADQLTISRDGILRGETGSYMYVAADGGEGKPASARLQPVEVLYGIGGRAVIRGPGLQAGAKVVVEGNERLYPGAALLPQPRAERSTGTSEGGQR